MAFDWDHAQIAWLRERLAGKAEKFADKITVAGSALELDAAALDVSGDEFFDFLTRFAIFENKAPSETLDEAELLLSIGRAALLARHWELGLDSLEEATLVVLCSGMSRSLRRSLGGTPLRPGILEVRRTIRLVIVEANRLPVEALNLPILIRFASGRPLRRAIERIVDEDRREHHGILWLLRRDEFLEVLTMKGKVAEADKLDIAGSIRAFGIEKMVRQVGLKNVIDAVGVKEVIDAVGVKDVIDAVGVKDVIDAVGVKEVIDAVGVKEVIESIGLKEARAALEELERGEPEDESSR